MAIAQGNSTRSRRNKRRSHHHLTPQALGECSHCNHPKPTHTVCPNCGFYKGRQVFKPRSEHAE